MRRQILGFASFVLALASPMAANTAWAHGGRYSGPAGEVPPDSRQPSDPPPPDTGGGTQTPPDTGGGGTETPPDTGGGTSDPPDGGTPDKGGGGGDTPNGPGTGPGGIKSGAGKSARKSTSYESWRFWWHANKDGIFGGRQRMRGGASASTGGLGEVVEGDASFSEEQNISAKALETRVVSLLKKYARDRKVHADIQASAVLGLARMGRREEIPLLMEIARNAGAERYDRIVQETAALALGVMQERTPEVRRFLGELAADLAGPVRTRCFAAFALGLLGDRTAPAGSDAGSLVVLESLVTGSERSKEIGASALVAMGLLGDPAAVPHLIGWLREEKAGGNALDDLRLSYVAAALGKIGRPGLARPDSREVVDALRDRVLLKSRMTRYSSILALGQIAPNSDPKVQRECVSILAEIVKGDGKGSLDAQSTNFALTALGRIAGVAPGPDGRGGCPEDARARAMDALLRAFEGKAMNRPFAALGLGLAAMDLNEARKEPVAERIRETVFRLDGDVEQKGALVIALGLLRDAKSSGALRSLLADRGAEKPLRGTAAVALGLIGDRDALGEIRAVLTEREDRELRMDAAVALGLLRDSRAVDLLVESLKDPKSSQFVLGSAAVALGKIGDQRAVEPLAGILEDGRCPDLTRALACVALGQIGDRNDIPVLSRVSEDVNYRAYYDAIGELMTIL